MVGYWVTCQFHVVFVAFQLWIGMAKIGKVYIYDLDKFNRKTELELSCRGVSTMILVDNQVYFIMKSIKPIIIMHFIQ